MHPSHLIRHLSGDADDAASGTETSVAGLEGVGVSSLAEVVGAGVDDDGALGVLAWSLVLLFLCQLNSEKIAAGGVGGGAAGGMTYADDAIRADELDQLVGGGAGGVSLGISAEVAEVTNVALLVGRGTVVLATGVDWEGS